MSTRTRQLRDTFGRIATDLRVSVTDRCNLRCTYCIPSDARDWIPRDDLLTTQEFARLCALAVSLGVRKIRFTGGEPLLRPDLEDIVAAAREAFDAGECGTLALTTNAVTLERRLPGLIAAGITRINISLDSTNPARFAALSQRERFDDVMRGIEAAVAAAARAELDHVKLNSVILDRESLREIPDIVRFCLDRGIEWRAIEFMPIGPLAQSVSAAPTAADIRRRLSEVFDVEQVPTPIHSPARRMRVSDGERTGTVGIIASTTEPFCANCARTRLSANGRIYNCLFTDRFTDLAAAMRRGASDDDLAALWVDNAWSKAAGHFALAPLSPARRMADIGG